MGELVSVILTTYNRKSTIVRAIDSVLNQTYQNIELIIVDDASDDGTFDMVFERYGEDERITYIINDINLGPGGARNAGVESAKGKWIAFQDSDDEWHADKLEKQMSLVEGADLKTGMVYSRIERFWNNGQTDVYPPDNVPDQNKSGNIHPYVLIDPLCSTHSMLIRKDYFEAVGGFATDIYSLEDYEFSNRFSKEYEVLLYDEPLVKVYETVGSEGKRNINDWNQLFDSMQVQRAEKSVIDILIIDYLGNGKQWLADYIYLNRVRIVGHLQACFTLDTEIGKYNWNYIFVNEQGLDDRLIKIFNLLKIPRDKIIFIRHLEEWVSHIGLAFYLIKDERYMREIEYDHERNGRKYVTCEVEGISYIASSNDKTIMRWMYVSQHNWADAEMHVFYKLVEKYYDKKDIKDGYFCDIGANIGTTCIYFKKVVDPSVNILAFEPQSDNYKMLVTNMLLNNMEKGSIVENLGLSSCSVKQKIYLSSSNPGQNSILIDYGQGSEEINTVAFDEYLLQRGISGADIKYMWIDTEGFEPMVLSGAKRTLEKNDIPVFMEFNPYIWKKEGVYNQLMEVLESAFTRFVVIQEVLAGKEVVYDICEIWKHQNDDVGVQYDIFLIK